MSAPLAANQAMAQSHGAAIPAASSAVIRRASRQPRHASHPSAHAAATAIDGILYRPITPVSTPVHSASDGRWRAASDRRAAPKSGSASSSSDCARAQYPPHPGDHSPTTRSAATARPAARPHSRAATTPARAMVAATHSASNRHMAEAGSPGSAEPIAHV